jgi:Helix-loop-helix DNA-binding domain
MVEKQYRNRLNGGFASLLAKIPLELAASSGLEIGGKNVSKAETLALAERYIKTLQEDGKELVKKNRRLEEDYDRLRKAWIASGGVLMP